MPRAVVPDRTTTRRILPFLQVGQLLDQGGAVLEDTVPCTVWPARGDSDGPAGRNHDHVGEAPIDLYAALSAANRVLLMDDGRRFKIVSATLHPIVPHVALELRSGSR